MAVQKSTQTRVIGKLPGKVHSTPHFQVLSQAKLVAIGVGG